MVASGVALPDILIWGCERCGLEIYRVEGAEPPKLPCPRCRKAEAQPEDSLDWYLQY